MGPTRQERTEMIARERKQQILDAALEVFTKKGFGTATTAEIARTAGVAEGTVFKYFRSKRELFIAVIKGFVMSGPFLELIDRLPAGDIAGTFRLIMENRFQLIQEGPFPRIPMLMADVIRDPELKSLWIKEFLHPFLDKLAGMYRSLVEAGIYRDVEPDVAVRTIGGMIFGFLFFKVLEGEMSPLKDIPQEATTAGFTSLMLHGLLVEREDSQSR